jgi:hypothetical protein
MQPLTEQILARLPGRRDFWIVGWSPVPALNAGLNLLLDTESAVWEQSRTFVVLNYLVLSVAVFICLWGARRIAQRVDALGTTTVVRGADAARRSFREMNNVVVPLTAAVVTAVAFAGSALAADGWASAAVRGITWLFLGIALWTFLWTYGVLQLGLARLGGEVRVPNLARLDPTLGMRPFGDAAFMGLWMLLAWLIPLVLTGLPDIVGVALGVLILAGALVAFFFSLLRLHWQMVAVKDSEVALARELYAQAYEPLRATPTLETVRQQRDLLAAADVLEHRAQAIHEWPIDQGTFATVITIATSVVAITIGRLILSPLGL